MDQKEIYELLAEKLGAAALGFNDEGVEAYADVDEANSAIGVALAMGQDWRSIEAGAHAFAALSGQYKPLVVWRRTESGIRGELGDIADEHWCQALPTEVGHGYERQRACEAQEAVERHIAGPEDPGRPDDRPGHA